MSLFSLKGIWGLKQQLLTLLLALRDKRTPAAGRVLALLSILYLVSPIDALFDGLPLIGVLDDLVLVPFGLWLARERIPPQVLEAARIEAERYSGFINLVLYVLFAFLAVWLLAALALIVLLMRTLVG